MPSPYLSNAFCLLKRAIVATHRSTLIAMLAAGNVLDPAANASVLQGAVRTQGPLDSLSNVALPLILLGGVFGLIAAGVFRLKNGKRAPAQRRSAPVQDFDLPFLQRAEAIARFGTYEVELSQASRDTCRWSMGLFDLLARPIEKGALSIEQYIHAYVAPLDRERVEQTFSDALRNRHSASAEYRIVCEDGTVKDVYEHLEFLSSQRGQHRFAGQIFDLTHHKPHESQREPARSELEQSNHALKKLINQLEMQREEDQRRFAREMHDDLGQLLAILKIDLCKLEQYLPSQDVKARQCLEDMQDLVTTMVTSVRRILANLPPKVLEDLGLANAVRYMARNFEKHHGIVCDVTIPEEDITTDHQIAAATYRMIQEALNNVAKHAHASRVVLRLDLDDHALHLSIADNGIGMPPGAPEKAGSCGLMGMRERLKALGGTMQIDSGQGTGTTIRIEIPATRQMLAS